MSTDTLESTTLAPTNTGDHDKFQHYFTKREIEANLFYGVPMTALCGKVLEQQSDPKDKTICPTCIDIFENVVGMNLPGRDGRDS